MYPLAMHWVRTNGEETILVVRVDHLLTPYSKQDNAIKIQ